MKIVLQFFLVLLLTQTVLAQEAIENDVPQAAQTQVTLAENYRDQDLFAQSQQIYTVLRTKYPKSFVIAYNYGRLLAQMKQYQKSAETLQAALQLGTQQQPFPDPTLYNTIGYVYIMQRDFDQALEYFKKAASPELYTRLPENIQMKLHNNTGYALMLADRYEESLQEFKQAKMLGSKKAEENIEKVRSLIETQEKQDPNLPGVFAVIIGSSRMQERLDSMSQLLMEQIQPVVSQEKWQEINKPVVYVAKNGMYFITLASNLSYAKAQQLLPLAKKAISDAFVSSTTNWEPYQVAGEVLPQQQN